MKVSRLPGLYVHVPFCVRKCPYCAFYSVADRTAIGRWLAALAQEAASYRRRGEPFGSLYLGGGTPSALTPAQLERLFRLLHDAFSFHPRAEVTMELNPADLTARQVALLGQLGVNRASLGIQSFERRELRLLGRRHDAAQAERAFELLRAGGPANLSIDLIGGLPGQSLRQRLASVSKAVALGPEHICSYELTFEPGTELWRRRDRGTLKPLPARALDAGYTATVELLAAAGYAQYEVSAFARRTELRSQHNQRYWQHVPYLGLGPAAHSFDGRRRFWNVASVAEYCRRLEEGGSALFEDELLTAEQLRLERLALGFRTRRGVARQDLGEGPSTLALIEQLTAEGLIEPTAERVMPTSAGLRVADGLARAFASP